MTGQKTSKARPKLQTHTVSTIESQQAKCGLECLQKSHASGHESTAVHASSPAAAQTSAHSCQPRTQNQPWPVQFSQHVLPDKAARVS